MKFMLVKFRSGTFGVQTQEPLTEQQAEELLRRLEVLL